MKINKLNYEAFMIDYIEGNLSHSDRQAMDFFLNENPELKMEINMYLEAPVLKEDPSLVFNNKAKHLKKEKGIPAILWLIPILLIASIGAWYLLKEPAVAPAKEQIMPMAEKENFNAQRILTQVEENEALANSKTIEINDSSFPSQEKEEKEEIQEMQEMQESNKSNASLVFMNQQKSGSDNIPSITNTEKRNEEQVSVALEEPIQAKKNEPKHIVQFETEVFTNQKIVALENLSGFALKSIETNARKLNLRDAMVMDTFDISNSDIVLMPEQAKKKWWKVFVPQAYEDVNLDNVTTASATFQSVAEDKESSVMPLQTIKK